MTVTGTQITSGQKKQYRQLVKEASSRGTNLALAKVGNDADQEGWQRVLERGDEIRTAIAEAIVNTTQELSITNRYANEEVESGYGYLSDYKKSHGIIEQTNRLRELFPGIGFADEKLVEQSVSTNAEGWFAIPRWQQIASTYGEACQKVFDLIRKTRGGKFCNSRDGQLGPQYLRQSKKSAKAWEALGEAQEGYDILVVPAQFGLRHRGRSVRRALEVMNSREFGLGTFAIGIMILTHPKRLANYDDLWIDCAGDEFSPDGDGDFLSYLFFSFGDGRVKLYSYWDSRASGYCGSVSGFLA